MGIPRIKRKRALQHCYRRIELVLTPIHQSLQEAVIGSPLSSGLPPGTFGSPLRHSPHQSNRYGLGYLVLDSEDIREVPIIFFRPEMRSSGGLNELNCDSDVVAGLLDLTFENVCYPELLPDVAPVRAKPSDARRATRSS